MSWNPNSPSTLGLEWPVVKDTPTTLNAPAPGLGVTLGAATVAEDIKQLKLYATVGSSATLGTEVYRTPVAAEAAQDVKIGNPTATYLVPVSTPSPGTWVQNIGATVHEAIDDGAIYSTADYAATNAVGSPQATFRLGYTSTSGKYNDAGIPNFSGRRIAGIGFYAYIENVGTNNGNFSIKVDVQSTTYNVVLNQVIQDETVGATYVQGFLAENPATSKAWTPSDLERFSTAMNLDALRIQWTSGTPSGAQARLYALYAQVFWVEELRDAFGEVSATATGWQTITVGTPEYYNRLGLNQSNFDTVPTALGAGTTSPLGWSSVVGFSSVLRTTTTPRTGAGCLELTASGGVEAYAAATAAGADPRDYFPVVGGQTYTASFFVRTAVTARPVRALIFWHDETGSPIGAAVPGAYADDTTSYVQRTCTAVAPVNATSATIGVNVGRSSGPTSLPVAAEIHRIDDAMFERNPTASTFVNGGAVYTVSGTACYPRFVGDSNVVAIRRLGTSGSLTIPGPDSLEQCPHVLPSGGNSTLLFVAANGNTEAGIVGDYGTPTTPCSPVIMVRRLDSAASVDSQPYVALSTETVTATNTLEQEFTSPGATLSVIEAVVRKVSGSTTQALTIEVRGPRPATTVRGTVTVTAAEAGTALAAFAKAFSPAFLFAAASQYYWRFSTLSSNGWVVAVLDTRGSGSPNGNTATFGGTTDQFTNQTVGGEQGAKDAVVKITAPPSPPGGFGSSLQTVGGTPDPDFPPASAGCDLTGLQYIQVTWTPVGGSFSYYQIWRDLGDGNGFNMIAQIFNQAASSWNDSETPIGVPVTYKMLYVRGDGSSSTFTTTTTRTVAPSGCKWQLTSNYLPSTSWMQGSSMSDTEFEFDSNQITYDRYGLDERVTYIGIERRGDRFNLDFMFYGANDQPVGALAGRRAFDAIRELALSPVAPYICVRNAYGDVWYASVVIRSGMIREPGGRYSVALEVVELSATPYTIAIPG